MHLRSPSIAPGVVAFLWGLGLGAFVWLGCVGIGVSKATALILGALTAGAVFLLVRLYGEGGART